MSGDDEGDVHRTLEIPSTFMQFQKSKYQIMAAFQDCILYPQTDLGVADIICPAVAEKLVRKVLPCFKDIKKWTQAEREIPGSDVSLCFEPRIRTVKDQVHEEICKLALSQAWAWPRCLMLEILRLQCARMSCGPSGRRLIPMHFV